VSPVFISNILGRRTGANEGWDRFAHLVHLPSFEAEWKQFRLALLMDEEGRQKNICPFFLATFLGILATGLVRPSSFMSRHWELMSDCAVDDAERSGGEAGVPRGSRRHCRRLARICDGLPPMWTSEFLPPSI
jgi:hypothetical protein